jgi:hypothetical protein
MLPGAASATECSKCTRRVRSRTLKLRELKATLVGLFTPNMHELPLWPSPFAMTGYRRNCGLENFQRISREAALDPITGHDEAELAKNSLQQPELSLLVAIDTPQESPNMPLGRDARPAASPR